MAMKEFDPIAFVALIVSMLSLFLAWRAARKVEITARENINIQHATIETSLRQSIENARTRLDDVAQSMIALDSKKKTSALTIEEDLMFEALHKRLDAAIESWLNTYENACSTYLDKKIDKVRFQRNYHVEIRNLVERDDLKKFFDPNTSRYKPILKVYKEWNDHENH